MRLLLVEDDNDLRRLLRGTLVAEGFAVDEADEGEDGKFLGETETYDAIILDVGLPLIDGLTILSDWRANGVETPVLLLTARDSWRDKVDGLRRGADDYLAKPFQTEELLARLEALIRRRHGHASSVIRVGDIEIDLSLKAATAPSGALHLTPNEFRAFAYLALNRGRVISKTELTEHIYDQDFDHDSNVIEAVVARLRKKIGANQLKTQRGHGYYVE